MQSKAATAAQSFAMRQEQVPPPLPPGAPRRGQETKRKDTQTLQSTLDGAASPTCARLRKQPLDEPVR